MKEGMKLRAIDYYLFGIACVLLGIAVASFLLQLSPISVLFILVKYKWVFLFAAILVGIRPWWVAVFGKKSAEGIETKTTQIKVKKVKVNKEVNEKRKKAKKNAKK